MPITVRTIGVHYRWVAPDEVIEQMRLAHRLRNDLVRLQMDFDEHMKEIWSAVPEVAEAEAEIAAAEVALDEALAEVTRQKVAQRTKRITGPASAALTETKARLRQARAERRAAISEARLSVGPAITDARDALRSGRKDLYRVYCQDGGLYWATFNDVAAHHDTAVKRITKDRAAGKPAALKFHRWDGTGSVAVQLQRRADMPPRSPSVVADPAGKYRNILCIPWVDLDEWEGLTRAEQRQRGRVSMRMRCGPGVIELPVQMQQMLPADADITGARLTAKRYGADMRWTVTVTAKVPDPAPVTTGHSVAVHLGWREDATGRVVVAHWRADDHLSIPEALAGVVEGDMSGTITLPAKVFVRMEAAADLRSARDEAFSAALALLAEWLDAHPGTPDPASEEPATLTPGVVSRWRSPGRIVRLVREWEHDPPDDSDDLMGVLRGYAHSDRGSWTIEARTRAKGSAYRSDIYGQVAAWLASTASAVILDDGSVSEVARNKTDVPNVVAEAAARRRTWSAPAALRAAIAQAATRDGVEVVTVESSGLSKIHAACGHKNPSDDRWLSRIVLCDGCGVRYDQDENALTHMFARAALRYTATA